jgi:MATE family multidrug resistance protein
MQVTTLTFMLPLSIGLAANVRVRNLVGSNSFDEARYSAFFAMFFALFLAIINTFILIEFGYFFASFFNPDSSIVSLASSLLVIAAIFQIADGLNFSVLEP